MFTLAATVFCFTMAIGLMTSKPAQKNPGIKEMMQEEPVSIEYLKQLPVPVEYFKQGQILLPDYACPDTLIVVDADGLNKGMALVEQGIIDATDYQIDSILHTHCKLK